MNFYYKIWVTFSFIATVSLNAIAGAYVSVTELEMPAGFYANYVLQPNGEIVNATDKSVAKDVFNISKNGALEWSVKSLPCAQNKTFRCVGIYKDTNSKIQGNQMNPLASMVSNSSFTMLKIHPTDAEQNSVIKCKSKLTQNLTRDEGQLGNCVEYSKDICKKWYDYINKNADEIRKVADKVEECDALMKSVDKININLRNIFQGDIKQSEKNISESYDATTHPDRLVGLTTKTELAQEKPNTYLSTYNDMFDHTNNCETYSRKLFVKGYSGTSYTQKVSSKMAGAKNGSVKKGASSQGSGRN